MVVVFLNNKHTFYVITIPLGWFLPPYIYPGKVHLYPVQLLVAKETRRAGNQSSSTVAVVMHIDVVLLNHYHAVIHVLLTI